MPTETPEQTAQRVARHQAEALGFVMNAIFSPRRMADELDDRQTKAAYQAVGVPQGPEVES